DEFTNLLADVPHPSAAAHVAELIIDTFQQPFALGGREVFVTPSIGIALNTGTQGRPADLLREADIALYQAKAAGKATFSIFDAAFNVRTVEWLDLETDLRRALGRGELQLHFQPEVDLATGTVLGMDGTLDHRSQARSIPSRAPNRRRSAGWTR
ncbi:MAG: diguanylate cyclase domain-containing protein, partial [Dehalococcoidia bacterium]